VLSHFISGALERGLGLRAGCGPISAVSPTLSTAVFLAEMTRCRRHLTSPAAQYRRDAPFSGNNAHVQSGVDYGGC
jgi:hypothetical protein